MPELVQAAVFGNVGTRINFRVGATDAEYLEKSFGEKFLASDIVSLSRFQIYLILMIDGVGSTPFSARTLPPIELPERSYREEIIASSRNLFAGNRKEIEDGIVAWMFDSADERQKKRERNQRKKSNKRLREQGKPIPDRTGRGKNSDQQKPRPIEDAPIEDLPGAASFKDAFAALVPAEDAQETPVKASRKKPSQPAPEEKRSEPAPKTARKESPFKSSEVPDSIKKDTKKYSIGAALQKKEIETKENRQIHSTRDVSQAIKKLDDKQEDTKSKNKFAFSFDESTLADKASHTLPPLHPIMAEEQHPVVVEEKPTAKKEHKRQEVKKHKSNQNKKNRPQKKKQQQNQSKPQGSNQSKVKRGGDNKDLKNLLSSL